jgi:hypothetical protein
MVDRLTDRELLSISVGSCTGAPREGHLPVLQQSVLYLPFPLIQHIHAIVYTHIHINLAITVNISMSTRAVSSLSRGGGTILTSRS